MDRSVRTSTPVKKFNKSYSGSETSFTDQSDSFRSQKNDSSRKSLTLESFMTDGVLSPFRENVRKVRKKKTRWSQSPSEGAAENYENVQSVVRSRRIKPTILSEVNQVTINNANSFSFVEDGSDVAENASEWRRSILQKEKEKVAARNSDIVISAAKYPASKTYPVPSIKLVTNVAELQKLSAIYVTIIENNLVVNVLSEIHFVTTLLLSNSDKNVPDTDVFGSIHNSVYFAANVLQKLPRITALLNRPTLKLLIENERLKTFAPSYVEALSKIYNKKLEKPPESCFVYKQMPYVSETDNRDNFPTTESFLKFKKQRDLFYDILRTWEANHNQPEWSFELLGSKIRALLTMHEDPANYYHLARLFKNLMLNSGARNDVSKSPDSKND